MAWLSLVCYPRGWWAANRTSVLRGKWIPGVQEEMQNLLARQHFNTLTTPLVSTTSKHQTPQELGSGHPCPSASMCVCSGCLHCKNEEKRAFFLRTTLLDTHRFFMGSCGWGWACSEEGLKRHQAESHYLLCFPLCHCSRRLSRKFWCNLKLTITQYNPKFI